jgi:hypothetical protein
MQVELAGLGVFHYPTRAYPTYISLTTNTLLLLGGFR